MSSEPAGGTEDERPPAPFVVGTGRSGTTLLRMMLDAHSQLAIPPETNFGATLSAFVHDGTMAAVETIVASPRWGDFNLDSEELRGRVEKQRPANLGDVLRAFYSLYAERQGKPRWGDKSTLYVQAMAQIQEHLPEARFAHIVRDGRDVALSVMPLPFGPDSVTDAARLWVRTLEMARSQAPGLPHYTEIRYEDLVRDPAAELQRLCGFLELEWEPAMLDYHRDAPGRLSSELVDLSLPDRVISREERLRIHRLLDRPPQGDRSERWRREMSAADKRAFERIAGEKLTELGYATS